MLRAEVLSSLFLFCLMYVLNLHQLSKVMVQLKNSCINSRLIQNNIHIFCICMDAGLSSFPIVCMLTILELLESNCKSILS